MVTTHNLGLAKTKHTNSTQDALQQQQGFDFISVGCTGVADPMVTMMDLLGHQSEYKHFKAYTDAPWFGSNTHCVVPEFTQHTRFKLNADDWLKQIQRAKQTGSNVKPIIIGPASYLWFSKASDDVNKLDHLEALLNVYADMLEQFSEAGIEWVQFDEPVMTQELDDDWKHAIVQSYFHLQRAPVKKLLACYFGKVGDNLGLLRELIVDGVHLDTISADDEALKVADWLPNYKIVSVSVVDGSQLSVTDYQDTLAWLKPIYEILGDRLWLAPSCSFIYMDKHNDDKLLIENIEQKLSDIDYLAQSLDKTNKSEVPVDRKAAA